MTIDLLFNFLILQVYLTLCCTLIASAAGAYLHILWNIGGIVTLLGCLGCMIWVLATPHYEEVEFIERSFFRLCTHMYVVLSQLL